MKSLDIYKLITITFLAQTSKIVAFLLNQKSYKDNYSISISRIGGPVSLFELMTGGIITSFLIPKLTGGK